MNTTDTQKTLPRLSMPEDPNAEFLGLLPLIVITLMIIAALVLSHLGA